MAGIRSQLVRTALEWERLFGCAPSITSALSEYDASKILGLSDKDYGTSMIGASAVRRGYDFTFSGKRYQVKANRPSGKPGSAVTRVAKARNFDWDFLIWILYNSKYEVQEAWLWHVKKYKDAFAEVKRLSPSDLRRGERIL